VLWHQRDLGPDLALPGWWQSKHGPPVAVRVVGTPHYQDVLTRLRTYAPMGLSVALYPEPDNPHDSDAVAVIAAGRVAGYLSRDYAALWQPVVIAEHVSGRVVTGSARFTNTRVEIGLTVTATQPPPPVDGETPAGPPVPTGQARLEDFWPHRELTRKARRQHRHADTRDRWRQDAAGILGYGEVPMTATEAKLYHYLAQCPGPFLFYPQVPFSALRLDFYCPYATLCVEVDGPEHKAPERRERDQRRNRVLRNRGIKTYRITNKRVNTNPCKAAMAAFGAACKRTEIPPPSDPDSPYHGWLPAPPLRPRSSMPRA
jgi:very-short-patch-repair endonuclease